MAAPALNRFEARVGSPLELGAAVLFAAFSGTLVYTLADLQTFGADFAPIWVAAANPGLAYDAAAISAAQDFVFGFPRPRPFAYPPTALLLFWPFGQLPFYWACGLVTGAAAALFVYAARGARWWMLLLAPIPAAVFAGQVSLLAGALIFLGFQSRGLSKGLLFAAAAAVKPQLCLFLPLAMLFDRDWRSFAAAAATFALLAAGATLAFGTGIWAQWAAAAADLSALVERTPDLDKNAIATMPLFAVVPALLLVYLARDARPAMRYAATVGSAVMVVPYVMNYELLHLAPAVAQPHMLVFALVMGLGYTEPTLSFYVCFAAIATVLVLATTKLGAQKATHRGGPSGPAQRCDRPL